MPNENQRGFGERLAAVEERIHHLVERADHLDDCVDGVKMQAEKNAQAVRVNMQTWDRRWWIGLGVIVGMLLLSGTGPVSLHSLLALIEKLNP